MDSRSNFLNYIQQVNTLTAAQDIENPTLQTLQQDIEHAELIVPVVGAFSAGKSTLINSFLGQNLLLTNVTPETALATELHYHSTENYLEAVRADSTSERHSLDNLEILRDTADNYQFLRLYLQNDHLKTIAPLVLVDMPGFDAPSENHNRAILNYLQKGCYFIFLTGIEDGNITRSMMREIDNISLFTKSFSFGLSKTNLRSSEDVQKVKQQITEQLQEDYDFNREVILFDDNGGENLRKILSNINPDALFCNLFLDALKDNYLLIIERINTRISALKSNKQTAEAAIVSLQNGLNSVIRKKERAIEDIESRYASNNIEGIINRISQTLMEHKMQLTQLALSNSQALGHELNELIRSSLLQEIQQRFDTIGHDIITDFSVGLKSDFTAIEGFDLNDDFLRRVQQSAEKIISSMQSSLHESSQKTNESSESKLLLLYRPITTVLGLTTSIVSPLMEAVIIFLPDIINYFGKDLRKKKMRSATEEKIVGDIIPQIKSRIRTILPGLLQQNIAALIKQISEQFEQEIQQKQQDIEAETAKKAACSEQIDSQIKALNRLKEQLNALANQYLFQKGA